MPLQLPSTAIAARLERAFYTTLAIAIIAIGWVPHLFWGLWLDETGTYWQAKRGVWAALHHSYSPGQSILYGAIAATFYRPDGHFEFWLRIPSVIGMLIAAYFIFRLAQNWFGTGAAYLALVAMLGDRQLISHATEARPYALALAACAGLMYGLDRWLADRRRSHWLLFTICAILLLYLHYVMSVFYLVPATFVLLRFLKGDRIPWSGIAMTCVLVMLSVLPLTGELAQLFHQGHTLSYTDPPDAKAFIELVLPFQTAFCGFVAACVAGLFGESLGSRGRVNFATLTMWSLGVPTVIAAIAIWRHYGIFLERHMAYTGLGLALMIGYFFGSMSSSLARACVALVFCGLGLAYDTRDLTAVGPLEWRAPLHHLQTIDPAGTAAVFMQSGFVESNAVDWQHAMNADSYLYAALIAYPIRESAIPLPMESSDDARSYCLAQLNGPLQNAKKIVIIANYTSNLTHWLADQLRQRGYHQHSESPNALPVLVFTHE